MKRLKDNKRVCNVPHGFGRVSGCLPNGIGFTFECHFNLDLYHGYFIERYTDGREMQGFYKNHMMIGVWIIKNKHGDVYEGEFMGNDPKGEGVLVRSKIHGGSKKIVRWDRYEWSTWFNKK